MLCPCMPNVHVQVRLKQVMGFVPQDDIVHEDLSVRWVVCTGWRWSGPLYIFQRFLLCFSFTERSVHKTCPLPSPA